MTSISVASNFREVAGQSAGGMRVRRGMLYRSDGIFEPSEADVVALRAAGIAFVCDLRNDGERAHAPNRWWRAEGATILQADLLGALPNERSPWQLLRTDASAHGARAAMSGVYETLPRAAGGHVVDLLRRIADGAVPILIHCTAGKDRTGFIVAVLLAALGVPREAIVADYLLSRGRRGPGVAEASRRMIRDKTGVAVSDDTLSVLLGVEADYLSASFAVIDDEYGGIERYLEGAGLTPAELAALRDRFLA